MKALKRILVILVIILLALISFGGIFIQKTKFVQNIVPEYKFGTELTGLRNITLAVSNTTTTIYYDSEGNIVEKEGENTTKKEVPINSEETLTQENYQIVKDILEKRLNKIKTLQYTPSGITEHKAVEYYTIKQDKETGKVILQIPENEDTDMILQYIAIKGTFSITDDKNNILMNNSHIQDVNVGYSSTDSGITVYLTIQLNKEGTEKLKEISNTYIKTTDEEGNDTTKKITIKIDDTELISTYFSEEIANGMLQLSFGTATSTGTELANYAQEASNLATLLNTGDLPIVYTIDENRYILSDVNVEATYISIIVIISIIIINLIILICNYKVNGIFASLSIIGYIATLLLVVRITNVLITLEGIVGIILSIILNYIFVISMLKQTKKDVEEISYLKSIIKFLPVLVPVIITTIVFCFVKWIPIYSLGMTMFWGIIFIILYNLVITKTLVFKNSKGM